MTHREPAASRKQCQLIQTTLHGTALVYKTALKHAQIFQYEECFALFNLLLCPADNLPDRKKAGQLTDLARSAENATQQSASVHLLCQCDTLHSLSVPRGHFCHPWT